MDKQKFWTTLLQQTMMYGIEVDYRPAVRKEKGKLPADVIPVFPWKNENQGTGSPLLELLKGKDQGGFHDIGPSMEM